MAGIARGWLLGALLLLFAGACDSQTGPDPEGDYLVRGEAPRQERVYSGALRIADSGPGYRLTWILDQHEVYSGAALYIDNVLGAVYWAGRDPGPDLGVVIYRIKDGDLTGTWRAAASDKTGLETLRGSPGLAGQYEIVHGENPDGVAYSGTVQMVRQGRIHDLRWYLPDLAYVGRGIRIGDLLVVGYGRGKAPGIVAYCMTSEDGKGVWSYGAAKGLGKEVIRRSREDANGQSDTATTESDCTTSAEGDLAFAPAEPLPN